MTRQRVWECVCKQDVVTRDVQEVHETQASLVIVEVGVAHVWRPLSSVLQHERGEIKTDLNNASSFRHQRERTQTPTVAVKQTSL